MWAHHAHHHPRRYSLRRLVNPPLSFRTRSEGSATATSAATTEAIADAASAAVYPPVTSKRRPASYGVSTPPTPHAVKTLP